MDKNSRQVVLCGAIERLEVARDLIRDAMKELAPRLDPVSVSVHRMLHASLLIVEDADDDVGEVSDAIQRDIEAQ